MNALCTTTPGLDRESRILHEVSVPTRASSDHSKWSQRALPIIVIFVVIVAAAAVVAVAAVVGVCIGEHLL